MRDVSTPLDMTGSPVVACYCATFLKPEMWHIYRQITALQRVASAVIAQKRENSGRFPFDKIDIVPKPALHFLRRFWFRQLRDKPWQISSRRASRANKRSGKKQRAAFAHLLWSHRRASPAANSRVEKPIDCFLSWRRCDGGHEQARISRSHAADVRRGETGSGSLGIVASRGR